MTERVQSGATKLQKRRPLAETSIILRVLFAVFLLGGIIALAIG
jgi:hypothetical protein